MVLHVGVGLCGAVGFPVDVGPPDNADPFQTIVVELSGVVLVVVIDVVVVVVGGVGFVGVVFVVGGGGVVVVVDVVVVVVVVVVVDVVVLRGRALIWTDFLNSSTKAGLLSSQVTSMTSVALAAVSERLETIQPSSCQEARSSFFLPRYLQINRQSISYR